MNSQLTYFQSDKKLTPTLFNNFGKVLIFIFYAQWNQQSKVFLNSFIESIPIFGDHQNVIYFCISSEKCPETFKKYNVQYTPTLIITQTDKKILAKFENAQISQIYASIEDISNASKLQFNQQQKIWHRKIKSILQSSPIIVFIKGTPDNPKCGFTESILDILQKQQVEYIFYDIIDDEYMRYWLREYKKWPTYPQMYINGQLIGGLDKIKQLIQKGQFSNMIPESARKKEGQERYKQLIKQHQIIAFIKGFTFQNPQNQGFLAENAQKYGENNIYIYNIGMDNKMKQHLQKIGNKLPFIVKEGVII